MEKFNGGFNAPRGCDVITEQAKSFGDGLVALLLKKAWVLIEFLKISKNILKKRPFNSHLP